MKSIIVCAEDIGRDSAMYIANDTKTTLTEMMSSDNNYCASDNLLKITTMII